ncbi:hypothetical protein [Planobispora takensis]|uniref:Uncharacterized protein n=1 Tax=Planobispora takensis TaxID=1367882 RepID=A0A8J3SX73_9ACTN|nr:hypothetical protein [Planobispora takensis]GII02132.1 hypothetical protein Pta02_41400 [Planobispora takensis]
MTADDRRPAGRRSPAFGVALTVLAVFLLLLAVPNVGTAVRAARADGIGGWFTPGRLDCVQHPGHESCVWTGDFLSEDGAVRRTGIEMYGADRYSHRAGERARAVDIGHPSRVYGPGGSNEWVFTALMLLAGVGIPVSVYGRPLRRVLGSGARREAGSRS